MDYVLRPWLAVTPWSQVRLPSGAVATVLPHWPPWQRRFMLPGWPPVVFTPGPMAMADVCEPDEAEALANLAAVFGRLDLLAEWDAGHGDWWRCPPVEPATVGAHLRDMHRTHDTGTNAHSSRSVVEDSAYHWQLHQQVLVHPLPVKHFHTR